MRPDLSKTIKPNNLKKQLLAKIKSHQQNHKEQSAEKEDVQEFQTNFKSSLNYLQTMIKQKKEKKQLQKKQENAHLIIYSSIPTLLMKIMKIMNIRYNHD